MPEKISMAAVILAGGKSSRMGQDKALLKFGNVTMLEFLADLMNSIFNETLIIVNEKNRYEHLKLGNAALYVDIFKDQGPLAGIYTGLSYSKHQAGCVFTCDMPFMDEALIRQLAGFWQEDYDALCLENQDSKLQPFPGIYLRSARHLIRLLLERKENSMHRFLEVATVKSLVLEKEKIKVMTNMNTIEDYYGVLSHLNAKGEANMVDVGAKQPTRRTAVAACEIHMKPETLVLLQNGKIKKGDAFTVAKTAAILAVKKTPELIPLCHPLPLEHIEIRFQNNSGQNGVVIECEVSTTAKTGVEIEALHGAMNAALTLYDMAKSYDPGMTIQNIHLIQKKGGKSEFNYSSRNSDGQ
ncbi:MAG: cyclic pyranopterin monophosphate synthase MoaC [Candidatus Omnitrophica bacterium]|nr:cyclic pyranopterin monophosphate synthase MoaC [Candidatus Omnitrophota bacterium]